MAAAVCFSSIVAFSLSPMLASKILRPRSTIDGSRSNTRVDRLFRSARKKYRYLLNRRMKRPLLVVCLFILLIGNSVWLFKQIPAEYAPKEDREAHLTPTWKNTWMKSSAA
jgi:multidrug efflux pump